jgi:hypothetical protein
MNIRSSQLDKWTTNTFESYADLIEELEYLLDEGYFYIGEITKVESK